MKTIYLISILMISSSIIASDDYITTNEGYLEYIGSCILHEDYDRKKLEVEEIIPYRNNPSLEFLISLPPVEKKIVEFFYDKELRFGEEGPMDVEFIDDISFDEVKIIKSHKVLKRISYGVGGGNGGYMTFEILKDQEIKLVAHTFDGDMLYCDSEYNQ